MDIKKALEIKGFEVGPFYTLKENTWSLVRATKDDIYLSAWLHKTAYTEWFLDFYIAAGKDSKKDQWAAKTGAELEEELLLMIDTLLVLPE